MAAWPCFSKSRKVPDQFNAVLHVPILPPVRVILRRTYAHQLADGHVRLGCSFVCNSLPITTATLGSGSPSVVSRPDQRDPLSFQQSPHWQKPHLRVTMKFPAKLQGRCISCRCRSWCLRVRLPNPSALVCGWSARSTRAEKNRAALETGRRHALRVAFRRSRTMAEALSEVNPARNRAGSKSPAVDLFFHRYAHCAIAGRSRPGTQAGRANDPVRCTPSPGSFPTGEKAAQAGPQGSSELRSQALAHNCGASSIPKHPSSRSKAWCFSGSLPRAWPRRSSCISRLAPSQRAGLASRAHRHQAFPVPGGKFPAPALRAMGAGTQRFQDLLGEIHDLDVLRALLRARRKNLDAAKVSEWVAKIDRERKQRLKEFQQRSLAPNSPWEIWREGIQHRSRAAPGAAAAAPYRLIA